MKSLGAHLERCRSSSGHRGWVILIVISLCCLARQGLAQSFRRGDANLDGWVTLSDAAYLVDFFHLSGRAPPCADAADVNDDGALTARVSSPDVLYLLDWLYPSGGAPPSPPPPFAAAGTDPTADRLDCANAKVTPFVPDAGARLSFKVPPALTQGQKGVEVFLHVSSDGPFDGLSLACLVNRETFVIAGVDFKDTLFPQNERAAFEASPYFRVAIEEGPDTHYDVLRVGAIFFDGRARIDMPFRRIAVFNGPLLRLVLNVKDTAPLGEGVLIQNQPPPAGLAGAITELVLAGETRAPEIPPPSARSIISAAKIFLRGDVNNDQEVDIADPVSILLYLSGSLAALDCAAAGNANDDPFLDISDPIYLLDFLFRAGPAPPSPFPSCAPDISAPDGLACTRSCGRP